MKKDLSSRLSEFQRRVNVILGIFIDLFRREDGLVKRKIGKHIMYLDPKDEGISKTLRRMRTNSDEREPAFMHILRKETKEGRYVQCYCDATIALPIISHALAERLDGKREGREFCKQFN